MRVILASGSPRRRELLSQIGIDFEVMVSEADEDIEAGSPELLVQKLSYAKASSVFENLKKTEEKINKDEEIIIVGADTVVAYRGKILGKPMDKKEAMEYLLMLQGNVHEVFTGVTLLKYSPESGEVLRKTFFEKTGVRFNNMSEEEILEYIDTNDPMDKAGAYGIQGLCARYISGIEGDYNNVVGLPVAHLYSEIKDWIRVKK